MATQSDLERYLWKVEERILTAGMNGPRSNANAHSQRDVVPLLEMLRLLQSKFTAPYVRCVVPTEELNRLAREAMGETK